MNRFDCTHKTVSSLEKELLFKEVMQLRERCVQAELLLDRIDRDDSVTTLQLKLEIDNFLGKKKRE